MAATEAQKIAIDEGIGGRLLELGFRKKSERLYVRETVDLEYWSRFRFQPERLGGGFRERTGIVSKSLQSLSEQVGLIESQYNFDYTSASHVHIDGRLVGDR